MTTASTQAAKSSRPPAAVFGPDLATAAGGGFVD
ncbi:hypothetical protein H4W32_005344 [Actinophytocola algeriensis]|uniref:Uncharacterized protein n=1 Tax=Actinophytocola algeriensis TaxID=1768010 RepID=A0A7W7VBD5_9PSEU|nr:hypothetical protein [Actinophytocola algeriensis]MBE1477302.1 hypothetical protein [Actinophytocola algeriensis]